MSNRFPAISTALPIIIGILAIIVISCSSPQLQPPAAKIIPKQLIYHNDTITDNYFWLRERGSEEVLSYLNMENEYTDTVMKHTESFQDALFNEMKGRIKETDLSVPVKIDSYYYYSRTEEGRQYSIYCRKSGSLEGSEEVLLDMNQIAESYEYCGLGDYITSPNHKIMAYTIDTTGREQYTIYFKNLETGQLLGDVISGTDGYGVWANDSKTFFYTTLDEIERPYKLYRHVLGIKTKNDVLVYQEKDKSYDLYISKSRDEKFIFMNLETIGTTEIQYLRADRPMRKFSIIKPRRVGIEYGVKHHGYLFYIHTNENAVNFKIMTTPVKSLPSSPWIELIPHRDSVYITGFDLFDNHLVLYESENALDQVWIQNLANNKSHYAEFPEPIFTVYPTGNHEFRTNTLRLNYTSMITPSSIYDYDMDSHKMTLMKQKEVVGGYDKSEYVTDRIYAEAKDGIKVPISYVYKKGALDNGPAPLYLSGYGSYGYSANPYFSSNRLSLLDRGFVYAKAHIRGGSDMGRWWYDDGKMFNKKNTFSDFIACTDYLVSEGYSSPNKMVISGGSAGGLLIGAVVNMRPELFHIAIADVPFVDVINTMMDASIPLTVNEYTEWGNPNEKESYDYIKSYSPYDNVAAQAYPHMLITAGLNDSRVQYWEPAKWTAKLRATKIDTNRLILKTNMGAGHGGDSGRYDYLRKIAFEYAFILDLSGYTE